MRTHGVYQAFRFAEGIWLHRKSRQIREKKNRKRLILHHTCATCSEVPSHTMLYTILKAVKAEFRKTFFNVNFHTVCKIN